MLPSALNDVIDALGRLPGVGSRTAERYAYFLLKSDSTISQNIADALQNLHTGVKTCPKTFAIMDASESVSPIYDDPARDKSLVLVVEEPLDIYAIERTKSFNGTYHVLGGAISPMDGITADDLNIDSLFKRINEQTKEVIIATNPTREGETTALYLAKLLDQMGVNVSRIANGLPVGSSLDYADDLTLLRSFEGRQKI